MSWLRVVHRPSPGFCDHPPIGVLWRFKVGAWSPHSDDVPESLPKYQGWRSFWNNCEYDSLCPVLLLAGCIARRTVKRLSHSILGGSGGQTDLDDLPAPWYRGHSNLTWRPPLQSAAYLSLWSLICFPVRTGLFLRFSPCFGEKKLTQSCAVAYYKKEQGCSDIP